MDAVYSDTNGLVFKHEIREQAHKDDKYKKLRTSYPVHFAVHRVLVLTSFIASKGIKT